MNLENKIKELELAAASSELNESYATLWRFGNCKVGVGVTFAKVGKPVYFVEFTVQFCGPNNKVNSEDFARISSLMMALESLGYELECDRGTLACEKSIPCRGLDAELGKLKELAEKTFGNQGKK